MMRVIMINSEYNRKKDAVGKAGDTRFDGQFLGTLVLTDDGTWLYYFRGKEEFRILG